MIKEDTLNIILKNFIAEDIDDTNYIIIKPDGTFYIFYGKYDLIGILDYAV